MIPFDLSRAKTPENPNGFDVVTENGKDVIIMDTNYKHVVNHSHGDEEVNINYPLLCKIIGGNGENDIATSHLENGRLMYAESHKFDLRLKIPKKKRLMTCQELSWWLRNAPEEYREYIYFSEEDQDHQPVHSVFDYVLGRSNEPVDSILIRSNGGEWREPIISDGGEWSAPHITEEDYEL